MPGAGPPERHDQRSVPAGRGRNARFGKPLYGTYGFARIPATVERLLTGEGAAGLPPDTLPEPGRRVHDKVILVVVDAFGWRFFEHYAERYRFLRRFEDEGVVSQLTTQFPSTTAAHVTTIHTGLPPAQSGVYEWFQYEPTLDRIIAPLLFSFAGDRGRNTLAESGASAEALFGWGTIYERVAARGVPSMVFQQLTLRIYMVHVIFSRACSRMP